MKRYAVRNIPKRRGDHPVEAFWFDVGGKKAVAFREFCELYSDPYSIIPCLVVAYNRRYFRSRKASVIPKDERKKEVFLDAFNDYLSRKGIQRRVDELLFLD